MKCVALLTTKLSLLIAATTFGQTWDGGATDDNWSSGSNWNSNFVPFNSGIANINFAGAVRPTPNIDINWSINALTFDNTSTAFTFSGNQLTINSGGITNNDADTQTFNNPINLGSSQTWNTAAGNLVSNGGISGLASLTKSGSEMLTLTGTNNYFGGTTINAGTLRLGDGITIGTITGNITNNGVLNLSNPIAQTISGNISGSGSLAKNSPGMLTLTNSNSFGGGTTINDGTIAFNNGSLGSTGNIVFAGNSTLRWNGSNTQDVSSRLFMSHGVSSTFDTNGNNVTFASSIGGSTTGSLIKAGAGTLTLMGFNSYLGGTTISGGTLSLGNGMTNGAIIGNITNNAILSVNNPTALALTGNISGSGSLTKAGAGTLTLTGNNTFTGGTTVSDGTLDIQHPSALGTGTLTINGFILANSSGTPITLSTNNAQAWNSNFSFAGPNNLNLGTGAVALNADRTLTVSSGELTVGGAINGTGFTFTKQGVGALKLSGNGNSFTQFDLLDGALAIPGGGALTTAETNLVGYSGNTSVTVGGGTGLATWQNSSVMRVGVPFNITGGGSVMSDELYPGYFGLGVVTVGGGTGNATLSVSGLLLGNTDPGTINIIGGGTVNSNYSSVGGSERTGTANVGGGSGSSTWNNSGQLLVGSGPAGTLNITGGGTVTCNDSIIGLYGGSQGTATVGGGTGMATWNITNELRIGQTGQGTLNIIGGGTVTNNTALIGSNVSFGTNGIVNVGNGTGIASWNNTQSLAVGGTLTALGGTAALNINSGGIVTTGVDTRVWTPGTINSSGGTASLGNLIMSGGTLNIIGGTVNLSNLTYTSGTLNFAVGTLIYGGANGAVVGSSGLALIDAGSVARTLITSATIDASKSLTITNTTTINPGRTLTINGGTFNTGSLIVNGSLVFNTGTLGITGASGLTIGAGGPLGSSFSVGGGRTLHVTNMATIQTGSTLAIDDGGSINAGSYLNQGTIFLRGAIGTISGGTLTNSGILRGDGNVVASVLNSTSGEIRGENGKTLTFLGSNGINAGNVNLQGGTVQFTQPLTNGSTGLITGRGILMTGGTGLNNLGNVALSSGITDVFGDVVNNTGVGTRGVQVSGNADVTFWDDVTNTSGLFRVSAGSSATFFGTYSGGSITGTGDVYFEGDVTPGFSPANVTLQTNTYFGPGAYLVMELGGTTLGTQYDHLNFQGTTALAGTLDVQLINGFVPSAGNSFDLFDGTLTGVFDTINLPTLSGGLTWNTSNLYTTGVLSVSIPGPNSWQGAANALWSATGSWTNGTVPSTNGDTALFANAAGAGSPVMLDANQTVNVLSFDSTSNFTIQPVVAEVLSLAGTTPSINTTLANTGTQTVAVALNLGNGTTISVAGGTLSLNSPVASVVGTGVTASTATGTTLQLAGPASSLNSTVNVTNVGSLSVTGTAQSVGNISGAGSTTVSGAGTAVTPSLIANDIDQTSLTISNGAYVRIAASGTSTSALTSLTIGTTANLDISDNDVVVNNPTPVAAASNLTAVAASVNAGFAGGNGIVTITIGSGLETVGFGLNSFLSYPTFNGVTVNDDSVLIKYTYFGDSNLDGFVTDDDLGYFLAGYGSDISANPWILGDYNHDGFTTDDDLGFFLAAYGSTPGLSGDSIQAIPEPSTLVLGTLAGLGLGALSLRRRRAKC